MKYDHVFEALPHVNEIWVTEDGHFHLHPHNGGKHITKETTSEEKEEPQKEFKPRLQRATKHK